ncbi:NUMOD4 motif-containing HNH endonuclease [Mesorhizobium sp. M0296]|uniref:NUMOD4 motif-containing HNH endonuclease n=1 Tax=Mesorhizobium sp. M0296 TaxID=2956931 RepID=UPI00333A3F11
MSALAEIWMPVVSHEGAYEVSNFGRVRSLDRIETYSREDYYSNSIVTVSRKLKGRVLRPGRTPSGHLTVAIGKGNSRHVHVLVLTAFKGPCPPGMEGLHGDDDPANNRLENLRWGTRSNNLVDAIENGKRGIGSRSYQAKLTEADVADIKANYSHLSSEKVASIFGVSGAAIRQIRSGKAWKHVA